MRTAKASGLKGDGEWMQKRKCDRHGGPNNNLSKRKEKRKGKGIEIHSRAVPSNFSATIAPIIVSCLRCGLVKVKKHIVVCATSTALFSPNKDHYKAQYFRGVCKRVNPVNGCTYQDAIREADSCEPKKPCIRREYLQMPT